MNPSAYPAAKLLEVERKNRAILALAGSARPYAEIKKYSIKSRCSAAHRGVDAAQQILCRRFAAFPKRFGAEQLMTAFDHIAEYAQDGFSMNRRLAELMPKGEDAFCTAA